MGKLNGLLFLILFSTTAGSAQIKNLGLGLKTGINFSSVAAHELTKIKVGPVGGIFVDYTFSNRLGVGAEMLYSMQGTHILRPNIDAEVNVSYMIFPILAKAYLTDGLAFELGIQPGFCIDANSKGSLNGNIVNQGLKHEFQKFDLSIPVGFSYLFPFGLLLNVRYSLGATNWFNDTSSLSKYAINNVVAVSGGWRF